jgi:hypothetical protein
MITDLASARIRVNPEECVQWLDDADVHIKRLLEGRAA